MIGLHSIPELRLLNILVTSKICNQKTVGYKEIVSKVLSLHVYVFQLIFSYNQKKCKINHNYPEWNVTRWILQSSYRKQIPCSPAWKRFINLVQESCSLTRLEYFSYILSSLMPVPVVANYPSLFSRVSKPVFCYVSRIFKLPWFFMGCLYFILFSTL